MVSAVCRIWASCQVSALICDCSVNFSYAAGPWQPRVCVHVRACAHQHLCINWCWTLCVPVQKSLLQASCRLHATGRVSLPPQLKFLRQKRHPPFFLTVSSPGFPSRVIFVPQTCFSCRLIASFVGLFSFSPWCPGIIMVLTHILFSTS